MFVQGFKSLARLVVLAPVLIAVPSLFGGCATIFTGTVDTLKFDANVPGARLTVDGQYKGELPLTLTMSRNFMNGQQFKAKFEKAGYVTQEFQLSREFNYVAVLDVTSIPTSGGIDLLTGSLMKFAPNEYHVQMLRNDQKTGSTEYQRSASLYRYALTNYAKLQTDIARGGGEYLASFAEALSGREAARDSVIVDAVLRNAPFLLDASSAHDFVARFNTVLGENPALREFRM